MPRIISDNIVLRPLAKADLENRVRWFNDPQVRQTLVVTEHFELEKTIRWFERLQSDQTAHEFAIETLDGVVIGVTGLLGIEKEHGVAECYCVIGNKDYWGKKLGTEIHSVLIQWAFEKLDFIKSVPISAPIIPPSFVLSKNSASKSKEHYEKKKLWKDRELICIVSVFYGKNFTPTHKSFKLEGFE